VSATQFLDRFNKWTMIWFRNIETGRKPTICASFMIPLWWNWTLKYLFIRFSGQANRMWEKHYILCLQRNILSIWKMTSTFWFLNGLLYSISNIAKYSFGRWCFPTLYWICTRRTVTYSGIRIFTSGKCRPNTRNQRVHNESSFRSSLCIRKKF